MTPQTVTTPAPTVQARKAALSEDWTVVALLGAWLTGKRIKSFLWGFPLVYLLTVVALVLAGNKRIKALNLEAVLFSLSLGLLVGNVFKLPGWLKQALATELFVKIGLVLLGTGVIFSDILKAGSLGLVQALVVVLSVWYFAYWLCKKLPQTLIRLPHRPTLQHPRHAGRGIRALRVGMVSGQWALVLRHSWLREASCFRVRRVGFR